MKLITAIVQPDRVDDLVLAVTDAGAHGMTVAEVIGFGQQYGRGGPVRTAGNSEFFPKVRVDVVVRDDDAPAVAEAIAKCANSGTIGDGKMWVSTVDGAIRVRTGERDDAAL